MSVSAAPVPTPYRPHLHLVRPGGGTAPRSAPRPGGVVDVRRVTPARVRRAAPGPVRQHRAVAGRHTARARRNVAVGTVAGGPAVHRRRRLVALALLAGVVAATALVGSGGAPATAADPGLANHAPLAGVMLIVGPRDTVWDVVVPHAPAGMPSHDWVATVLAHNGIEAGPVLPGTALRLPAW
jgi:hypothetical protein